MQDKCRYMQDICRYMQDICRYMQDICRYMQIYTNYFWIYADICVSMKINLDICGYMLPYIYLHISAYTKYM